MTTYWPNVPAGAYVLSAVAVDNQGLRATSGPVNVTVNAQNQQGIALGTTYTFATLPPVTDWSTLSIAGAGSSYLSAGDVDANVIPIPELERIIGINLLPALSDQEKERMLRLPNIRTKNGAARRNP